MKSQGEHTAQKQHRPPPRPRTHLIPIQGQQVPQIGHKWSVGEAPHVRARTSAEVYEDPADARQDAGAYVTGQLQRALRRGLH